MLIVGLSHKTAPIEIREKFYLNPLQQEVLLSELKNHPLVSECFVLSTCNRIEVYLKRVEGSIDAAFIVSMIAKIKKISLDFDAGSYIYTYEAREALEHLLRVACGLESMVLGEKQILGQVKDAIERARQSGSLSRYFNILTNLAVHTGKKAQHETDIAHGGSSISWAAIAMAQKACGGKLQDKAVLVIGAGKMGEIALGHLHELGIKKTYLMNRTGEKAEDLATKYNGIPASFWNIREILAEVDICFCAVGAPHYILDKEKIADIMGLRKGMGMVLIDISMPRNIDPQVKNLQGVHLSSIDDLHEVVDYSMKKREGAVHEVEAIIHRKIEEFDVKISKLQNNPGSDFFDARKTA